MPSLDLVDDNDNDDDDDLEVDVALREHAAQGTQQELAPVPGRDGHGHEGEGGRRLRAPGRDPLSLVRPDQ